MRLRSMWVVWLALVMVLGNAAAIAVGQELLCKYTARGDIGWLHAPAIGDINSDGQMEIVFGSLDNVVYALNADCTLLWKYETGDDVLSSPALGDIDGDDDIEVVIGSDDNYVYALNGEDGLVLWKFKTGADVHSSPTLGDIDGDGDIEVVVGSQDDYIYTLNGEDGSLLWKFKTGDDVYSSPALGDIDGDGNIEVVVGSTDHYIYALNGEDGSVLWKFEVGYNVVSSLALGDIDGDGDIEVVVGSNDDYVYALNGEDGSVLWKFETGDYVNSSPALGDIDSDGDIEVVIGSDDNYVYALNGENGSVLWKFETGDQVNSPPALGDIDGDGVIEVVVGSMDNNLYVLNGEDGSLAWKYGVDNDIDTSPAIGDVTGDGMFEIVFGSDDNNLYVLSTEGTAVLPELPGPWPKYRGNLQNTGTQAVVSREDGLKPGQSTPGSIQAETFAALTEKFILVPPEAQVLAIVLGSSGNLDLYVNFAREAGLRTATFSSFSPGGNEYVVVSKPWLKPGRYYIGVQNNETVEEEYTITALPIPSIIPYNEGVQTGTVEALPWAPLQHYLKTETGQLAFTQYKVKVPVGVSRMFVALEGAGNLFVHVRYNAPVEIQDERIVSNISVPVGVKLALSGDLLQPGIYYIAVEGLEPPQPFTITVTFDRE